MLQLAEQLDLPLIRQHSAGNLIFQDQTGSIRRDLAFATMGDALRIPGGLARITEGLAARLPDGTIAYQHIVTAIEQHTSGLTVSGKTPEGSFRASCRQVILALPPRLAAARIAFLPDLVAETKQDMSAVPTWMAGHAKLVAVYDRPFWRAQGVSGDAISHVGPLVEIHDASAEENPQGEAALFGFVSPQDIQNTADREAFVSRAITQLKELFGPEAGRPAKVFLKVWATDPLVATQRDQETLTSHPQYGPLPIVESWHDRLFLSGTETAPENGGFLEGALEAAERSVAWVRRHLAKSNKAVPGL
jgi:monoamine oxidase